MRPLHPFEVDAQGPYLQVASHFCIAGLDHYLSLLPAVKYVWGCYPTAGWPPSYGGSQQPQAKADVERVGARPVEHAARVPVEHGG